MPRKKAVAEPQPDPDQPRSLRKRSLQDIEIETTPSKRRRDSTAEAAGDAATKEPVSEDVPMTNGNGVAHDSSATETQEQPAEPPKTTPRKRGRPPKAKTNGNTPTPKAQRQATVRTPSKTEALDDATPRRQAGADRSARRKSARALIEHVVGDEGSEDEQDVDDLAREIYESSEGEDDVDEERDDATTDQGGEANRTDTGADTPSKTPKRGRKKRAKSPTPPRDLPPHELYFAQNKPGRPKTSNNTLASLNLLSHEEYFNIVRDLEDRHKGDIEYLESLHAESFPQWTFELSQGFSICLYGFGSKRSLLQRFARYLHHNGPRNQQHKIVIINGYAPTTTMREVLTTVGLALDQRIPAGPPSSMAQPILAHLSSSPDTLLTLVVNSIDAAPLRKPANQATLAQLAAHPRIHLACSADTPDFSLLWDIGLRSAFSFAFHDATTFAPYAAELDAVDDVHELLGRKARRVNGREGVAFVLRSLPENARNLFQLLVGEVLVAMEEDGGAGDGEDVGVEYRMVYNKAVEEFICSSEMAFRTLLKEWVPLRLPAQLDRIVLTFAFAGSTIIRSSQVGKMRWGLSCSAYHLEKKS